jgi:hypothetical protein
MQNPRPYKAPTQDAVLKRVEFSEDIATNATLAPGKSIDVRLFKATRPPSSESLSDITIAFYGKWPSGQLKGFRTTGNGRHLLVVEVTGNGVMRTEKRFELSFSAKKAESVFTIAKVETPPPVDSSA